ncbi:MAG: methylenetetrahydrofolate reductase [NAD(P)H] [Leptospirales bacterium]|nr:methylenetetrahydrofolate reductase [NAD(P)H] [Leptospirales bacterium]
MKKISNILGECAGHRPVFSFEFYPPKNEAGEEQLFLSIAELGKLRPDFVSVTYGAGGSTRERTVRWVEEIQQRHGITTMAHYTSIGASRGEVRAMLDQLSTSGVQNIIALRGDWPQDQAGYTPPVDGFRYGSELIAFIRSERPEFCLAGGCYPEKHPEAASAEADLANLKRKADAGADFLVSQLFFDNELYFSFLDRARAAGIRCPILPGIMPVGNYKQIARITQMAGCRIPEDLVHRLEACGEDREKVFQTSLEYSTRQCRQLLERGVPGIHFYTLNQSKLTMEILKAIR